MPGPRLDEAEAKARFLSQYVDPAFQALSVELERLAQVAWQAYADGRKAPITVKAVPGYADPDYELAEDWVIAKAAVDRADRTTCLGIVCGVCFWSMWLVTQRAHLSGRDEPVVPAGGDRLAGAASRGAGHRNPRPATPEVTRLRPAFGGDH